MKTEIKIWRENVSKRTLNERFGRKDRERSNKKFLAGRSRAFRKNFGGKKRNFREHKKESLETVLAGK